MPDKNEIHTVLAFDCLLRILQFCLLLLGFSRFERMFLIIELPGTVNVIDCGST